MEKRRIFIAINLPEKIKKELFNYQKNWPRLPCRWLKRENLHLTLAFLAYLNDEQLAEVFEITSKAALKNRPFSIFLNKVCYGPDRRIPPRLVWIQGERSEELLKLKNDLEKSLSEKIHFTPEKRDFLPHITLGRIRKWDWQRIPSDERPEVEKEVSINFPVNSIEVMESHLKRTGAEYEILESFQLKS